MAGPPGSKARCSYVVSAGDDIPGRPRFCDAPALPGSAYCAVHHARCVVVARSKAGSAMMRRLRRDTGRAADPPPELRFLASVPVAELDAGDDPADIAGCVDVAPERDAEQE